MTTLHTNGPAFVSMLKPTGLTYSRTAVNVAQQKTINILMRFVLGFSYNSVVQYWIVNFINDPEMLQSQKVERSDTNWLFLRSYTHR